MSKWLNRWIERASEEGALRAVSDRPFIAVCGPPGSGKTRLVSTVAVSDAFGAFEWVDVSDLAGPEEVRVVIANQLDLPGNATGETVALACEARGVDTLVLDGLARQSTSIAREIAEHVRTVVIRRQPPEEADAPRIAIGAMEPDEAQALFAARLEEQGLDPSDDDVQLRFESISRLPAAIERAARSLASPLGASEDEPELDDPVVRRLSFLGDEFEVPEAAAVLNEDTDRTTQLLRELRAAGMLHETPNGLMLSVREARWTPPGESALHWYCEAVSSRPAAWQWRRLRTLWRVVEHFGPERAAPVLEAISDRYRARASAKLYLRRTRHLDQEHPAVVGNRIWARFHLRDPGWKEDASAVLDDDDASPRAKSSALTHSCVASAGSLEQLEERVGELASALDALPPESRATVDATLAFGRFSHGAAPAECAAALRELLDGAGRDLARRLYMLVLIESRAGRHHEVVGHCARIAALRGDEAVPYYEGAARAYARGAELRIGLLDDWLERLEADLRWTRRRGLLIPCAWLEIERGEHAIRHADKETLSTAVDRAEEYARRAGRETTIAAAALLLRVQFAELHGDANVARRHASTLRALLETLPSGDWWFREVMAWSLMFELFARVDDGAAVEPTIERLTEALVPAFPMQAPLVSLFRAIWVNEEPAALTAAAGAVAALPNAAEPYNEFALHGIERRAPRVRELIEILRTSDVVCADDGSWVSADGNVTDLSSRTMIQQLLLALVRQPMSAEEIAGALWPGEKMTYDSLKTRVRSTVYQLRKTGIDVDFEDDAYLLGDVVVVEG